MLFGCSHIYGFSLARQRLDGLRAFGESVFNRIPRAGQFVETHDRRSDTPRDGPFAFASRQIIPQVFREVDKSFGIFSTILPALGTLMRVGEGFAMQWLSLFFFIVGSLVGAAHFGISSGSPNKSIDFVTMMGYPHEERGSFMPRTRAEKDKVALSIFVNPGGSRPSEGFTSCRQDVQKDPAIRAQDFADRVIL